MPTYQPGSGGLLAHINHDHPECDVDRPKDPLNDFPGFRLRSPGEEPKPGQEVESPTLPLPPPRDRDELERLLLAVVCTPSGDRQLIIDTLAAFDERDVVADLLHEALFELPVRDVGRHLTVLSLIGELRHDSSVEILERFVWLSDNEVQPPDSHVQQDPSDEQTPDDTDNGPGCHFEPGAALQARAAEMLMWVTRGDYEDGIRRILAEHFSTQVRVATIDALAYVQGDDDAVLKRLRELVRDDDRWAVGLPRRTADVEPAYFQALVERHQAEFGSTAELPGRAHRSDEGY